MGAPLVLSSAWYLGRRSGSSPDFDHYFPPTPQPNAFSSPPPPRPQEPARL